MNPVKPLSGKTAAVEGDSLIVVAVINRFQK
jgi:hypothetical protein